MKENNLSAARTEIDNVLMQEKFQKDPVAWYTKAKIYLEISKDANLKKQFPGARMDAFNALKKYTETDDKLLIALQIDGYKPINDIYTSYYQEAANDFNAKNYESALTGFGNAIMTSKFMTEKGWISLSLDTNSVLYAGVSAEKLGRTDEAVKYYSKLVEGKVKGQGFVEIYKWVANHYYENKKYTEANRMIALGKEVYPSDSFWSSIELDIARETGNKDQLFAKYEQIIATYPDNHLYRYNYAVELYQQGYAVDATKRPSNSEQLISKAQASVQKAVQIDPSYAKGLLFAGQIEYNKGVDKLKTNKEEALKNFDAAIPYFMQVDKVFSSQGKLNTADKNDLKEAIDLLITIYEQKKMPDKVKEYEIKFNEIDKKH